MTVITAMRFNSNSGGMVADSQGSNTIRKYDLFVKSALLGGKFILGGTGSSDVLNEASKRLSENGYDPKLSTYDNACKLSDILLEAYRENINEQMRAHFGFGVGEYISGKLADGTPIGLHVLQSAERLYGGDDRVGQRNRANEFVVIGKDENDSKIFSVSVVGKPTESSLPFATAGSGYDEADKVLHDFIKSVPRDDRNDIDFVNGMAALIRATNRASELNPGVGGIPTISYFNGEKSRVLPEQDSLLATEIVKASDGNLVSETESLQSLEGLLADNANFKAIEEKIFWNKNNYREIMEFLRGYRVN